MNKYYFPAVFSEDINGIAISFPDLQGCYSEADSLDKAYEMAFDAAGLYIDDMLADGEPIPSPKNTANIKLAKGDFVAMICIDMDAYYKKQNNKAVKKTLTLPAWLNDLAEKQNVNFSQVLQEALKARLQM